MTTWDDIFDAHAGRAPVPSERAAPQWPAVPRRITVDLPSDPATQEAWRRGVARLGGVRDPHVARVLGTRVEGQQLEVEHDVPEGALPLDAWIDSTLEPGQIVTLGVALARGLAALHLDGAARGGRLGVDDVIVDADGRPMWRLAHAVPAGLMENSDDVAAVAAMLRPLLAHRAAPGPLTLSLLRAEDEDPRRRPSAEQFADSLVLSHPAQPLRRRPAPGPQVGSSPSINLAVDEQVTAPMPAVEPPAFVTSPAALRRPRPRPVPPDQPEAASVGRRRPDWRLLAVAAVAVVALVGVLRGAPAGADEPAPAVQATGAVTARAVPAVPQLAETVDPATDPAPTEPEPSPATPTDGPAVPVLDGRSPQLPWAAVLSALDAARSRAFTSLDPARLVEADAQGSALLRADTATIAALRTAGLTPRGFAVTVVSATEISRGADSVLLRVVDRQAEYQLVTVDGAVRARQPARPQASWLITLVRGGSPVAWRLQEVRPADDGPV